MNQDDILKTIVDTLHETFEIERDRIQPQSRLYEDLDIDSIDAVDLAVKLKQLEFGTSTYRFAPLKESELLPLGPTHSVGPFCCVP